VETGLSSTGVSTPDGSQTGSPNGVNPAQSPAAPQNAQVAPATLTSQSSPADVSAVIASYENRIRTMMSEKDKAIHERNQAIAQLAELQQNYTQLQEQASSSLTQTANAAQSAITESQKNATLVQQLQGENQKLQLLLKNPHLAAYERYIPTAGTPEEQQKVIDDLNAIREADLAKVAQGQPPIVANPAALGAPQPNPAAAPAAYFNLLGQRTMLSPQVAANLAAVNGATVPGSTPAMMSPTGAAGTTGAIEQMLREARATGDPAKFQDAVRQAATLAEADIATQMGRR
jgi:hypothetical protein